MKFIPYHKIRQFKDVIRDIQFRANYKGKSEDGKPIYENSLKPTIKFRGTVKLHGTNAGICYTPEVGIVAQKRSSFLSPENIAGTHFGFNQFVQVTQKELLTLTMEELFALHCNEGEQVTLYGEWAGDGIQKGVGISEGKKAFYPFDAIIYNPITQEQRWVDISQFAIDIPNVYSIYDFDTYSVEIDFNTPALVQGSLVEITTKVEESCPVSKTLGHPGIGEGVVWTAFWKGEKSIFKVKGDKHSSSKVKTLASVNPELVQSIQEFVEYACTKNRILQGIQEVNATEKKHMPDLLRWVANDIIAEEDDVMQANNLEWKQVAREFSNRVRQYYFAKLETV